MKQQEEPCVVLQPSDYKTGSEQKKYRMQKYNATIHVKIPTNSFSSDKKSIIILLAMTPNCFHCPQPFLTLRIYQRSCNDLQIYDSTTFLDSMYSKFFFSPI